ncbi:hypothetical protein OK015_28830 (plasmid) [Mycobacterium sp. Aquia_216]|uniref:hypothetical protein n=1 Tax=Mycobacterium sp. Aquia_216 TaxID=2991729 RepID=UPI00227B9D3F|nr:hypothetical protein [Mycobacterium sp. Aquia_216]WAJ47959.1 hypothetical protein OK015_28830 [Mycobacterium sp. Aquia_216]
MSESAPAAGDPRDRCNYPGCSRPSRPDPATGRPSRYCEQADADGGPLHNRANAWRARRAQRVAVATQEEDTRLAAPVSLARATLEQRLVELPEQVATLRGYLDDVVLHLRAAGDVEAAGAEVEDAHRDALTKVTEAERRSSAAERAARLADERAQIAQRERDEADALAEETIAEAERAREQARVEIARIQAEAEAAVAAAHEQLAEAQAAHRDELAQRSAELDRARQDARAAGLEAAAARAAQEGADVAAERERQSAATLRAELEQVRSDAEEERRRLQAQVDSARAAVEQAASETATLRADLAAAHAEATASQGTLTAQREALASLNQALERQREDSRTETERLRIDHSEQLAQVQRSADERVHTLTEALTLARETAAAYRDQLPQIAATSTPPTPSKRSPRKRGSGTAKR